MKPVVYAFFGTGVLFAAIVLAFFLFRSPQEGNRGTVISARNTDEQETQARLASVATAERPGLHTPGDSERGVELRRPPGDGGSKGRRPADTDGVDANPPIARGNAAVSFELQDPNGAPVQNAMVTLLGGRAAAEALSDAQGVASFEDIEPGTYSFRVRVEGIPELSGANAVSVDPDEHRLISLSLGSYDLSISGRVLDRAGSPLQGVVVFAQKQIFGGRDEQVRHANPSSLRVTSRSDGSYEISGLDATDYLVHTEATEDFPPVRKIYRAGVTSADLILDVAQALEIYGTVTSEDGSPLEGVQVRAVGQTRQQRMTDAAGEYTVQLSLRPGHTTHSLVARKAGFRENRTNVRMAEIGEAESWEVDIRLQPMGAQVAVVGQVVDTGGNPVGSQTVHLHSAVNSARYKGISDLDGNFSIEAVQVGSDYRLWIYPPEGYRDYSRVVVEVAEAGAEMDIVLEELGLGSVRGTIVDSLGNAVPQFALWLRSMKALGNSISVTGDDAGEFVAEEVPEGELHFETRSLPRMTVRGIRLAADEVKDVRLVLDWGELSLTGTVLDETGDPVASANVLLNWKHNAKGILSSSFRNTVTDAQGSFKFSGLGAGDHRIEVSTPSHGSAKVQHEVGGSGSDPVIRLEAR